MQAAPHSCAAGTNVAPAASSALVTRKLPLPTTPKTVRTPQPASVRPTTCATSTRRSLPLDEREHPTRTARAAHDRQRPRDQHRARGRQGPDVAELGQAVLVVAEQV